MPSGPALFCYLRRGVPAGHRTAAIGGRDGRQDEAATRRRRKLSERRFIKQTGQEARIAAIIEPIAEDLGYRLVRVKMLNFNGLTLQVMAEDANGRFSIDDCERLSREINPALDVEDPIDSEYTLEVSSPGVDRVLVRASDFARWHGHDAKIELADMIDGRKRFRGIIETSDESSVTIRLPDVPEGAPALHTIAFANLAEAKLVMTDRLLEMAASEQDETLDDPDIETVEYSAESDN